MKVKLNKILACLDVGSIAATFLLWFLVYLDSGDAVTTLWLYFHLISLVLIIIYTVFSLYNLVKKRVANRKSVYIIYGLNTIFIIYILCAVLSVEVMGSRLFF